MAKIMTIELARSEIQRFSPTPWEYLNPSEQKGVAAVIMRNRPDQQSQQFAFMIESNNPNYSNFVVVENA